MNILQKIRNSTNIVLMIIAILMTLVMQWAGAGVIETVWANFALYSLNLIKEFIPKANGVNNWLMIALMALGDIILWLGYIQDNALFPTVNVVVIIGILNSLISIIRIIQDSSVANLRIKQE